MRVVKAHLYTSKQTDLCLALDAMGGALMIGANKVVKISARASLDLRKAAPSERARATPSWNERRVNMMHCEDLKKETIKQPHMNVVIHVATSDEHRKESWINMGPPLCVMARRP
jgi:hypothetical protein